MWNFLRDIEHQFVGSTSAIAAIRARLRHPIPNKPTVGEIRQAASAYSRGFGMNEQHLRRRVQQVCDELEGWWDLLGIEVEIRILAFGPDDHDLEYTMSMYTVRDDVRYAQSTTFTEHELDNKRGRAATIRALALQTVRSLLGASILVVADRDESGN